MEASSAAAVPTADVRTKPLVYVWRAIRPDVPFYVLVGAFVGLALLLHRLVGYPPKLDLGLSVGSWELLTLRTLIYATPAFVVALAWQLVRHGRSLRAAATWRDTVAAFFAPGRTLAFGLVLLALPPFMSAFTEFKAAIPDLHPFALDALFMEWDRLLHFGRDPWVLLHGMLGTPAATAFIDVTYSLWFAVLWLTVIWQAWHGSGFSAAREQFLLALAGCWIFLGVGAATLLSSAGPVYYGEIVGGANPFSPLVTYLHEVDAVRPLKAVWIHGVLWEGYVDSANAEFGEGISAMPSLHVSMAVLMTVVGFRVNRIVGWAYAAFAVLIMVGSVHLAWHYAVDGYVAGALTLVVWWASGKVTRAWQRRAEPDAPGT